MSWQEDARILVRTFGWLGAFVCMAMSVGAAFDGQMVGSVLCAGCSMLCAYIAESRRTP